MKHLIVYASPNPQSFSKEILEAYTTALAENGKQFVVRDLYAEGFNPVLDAADFSMMKKSDFAMDVKQEQELIETASAITLIYPIWWGGPPAILKGYFDRVFSENFAYSNVSGCLEKGLLGKRAAIINVMGAEKEDYQEQGVIEAIKLLTDNLVLEYTGLKVIDHLFFGHINQLTESEKENVLNEVRNLSQQMCGSGSLEKSIEAVW